MSTHNDGMDLTAFVADVNAEVLDSKTEVVPVQSALSTSLVKLYRIPFCCAFMIIKSESPDLSNDEEL